VGIFGESSAGSVGFVGNISQSQSIENIFIGLGRFFIIFIQIFLIDMKRIEVFHNEFPKTHQSRLGPFFVSEFGLKYGFLIKENRLLARGVVVIDKEGVVKYVEYVPDIIQEPEYQKTLDVVKGLI
jgi:hypothetical protein